MYESYWGLTEKPFENSPDPKYLYHSRQHNEALARLLYVVHERKGAVLLTGECGSGKTLLTRVLWQELQQEKLYNSAFILNPRLSATELVQEIVSQLGATELPPSKIELFHLLHKILYANYNSQKHTVVIIDEAQAIKEEDIFEELRLLLNFQLDNAFLLTIILLGQPELKYMLMHLPQFVQRIAVRFHLKALDKPETKEYILHRLKIAGAASPLFTEEALGQIYHFSEGVPRCVNTICDLSLLVAFGKGIKIIDEEVIKEVSNDLGFETTGTDAPQKTTAAQEPLPQEAGNQPSAPELNIEGHRG